jgi:hypothetical protein
MNKKRISKHLKLALLLLLGSTPFACCFLCCYPWPIKEQKTVAVRKDAQGNVVQEIILEHRYKWDIALPPIACGSRTLFNRNRGWGYKWFLEEPGKPRRELAFFGLKTSGPFYLGGPGDQEQCWPLEESSFWVYVLQTSPRSPHHEVVVFDDSQILHKAYLQFEQELEGTHDRYRFDTGKRAIVYRRNQEYEAYDVTTGTVTDWKPAEK